MITEMFLSLINCIDFLKYHATLKIRVIIKILKSKMHIMNNIIFHNILILLYNIAVFFYFVDQINSAFIYFKIVKNCFQTFLGTLMIITILYTLLYYIVIMIIKCCFFFVCFLQLCI